MARHGKKLPSGYKTNLINDRRSTVSYKPEVLVQGQWSQNNLAFATYEEAEQSAKDLYSRWMLVTDSRAVESDQPVNYKIVDNVMSAVEKEVS
jgi:hypothetical protein